jgi:hypothetical protein
LPHVSRRTILASTAGLAAAALPAVTAEAVSPTPPEPMFDAKAVMAKLDEIGLEAASDLLDEISAPLQERYGLAVICRWDVEYAAMILDSEPDDLLRFYGYEKHYARRLRDALAGRKGPIRIDYFDDIKSGEPRIEAHPGWDEEDEILSDLV